MPAVSSPLHGSSLLRTMEISPPPSRDSQHAARRQLASLDQRQFLANLQAAAISRSPYALGALKADIVQLDDIFHKLSKAGYDVSAARRDFQALQTFVAQLSGSSQNKSGHRAHYESHRTTPGPSPAYSSPASQSTPSNTRPRSSSISIEKIHSSTRQGQQQIHRTGNSGRSRSTPGSPPSSAPSSSSSSSSSRNSTDSPLLRPVPRRLQDVHRSSVPAASTKKVHFAKHAIVYTIECGGRDRSPSRDPSTTPPIRPACLPRVADSLAVDGRPRF